MIAVKNGNYALSALDAGRIARSPTVLIHCLRWAPRPDDADMHDWQDPPPRHVAFVAFGHGGKRRRGPL